MSWMTEKKANEKLKEYMQAELAGENDKAAAIEAELKAAGWKITVGPDGHAVIKDQKSGADLDDLFLPQESTVTPYSGSQKAQNTNTKAIWIAVGVVVGLAGITILIVYLVKRNRNAVGQPL